MKIVKFVISPEIAGTRLDRCLSRLINGSSRTFLQELIKGGMVTCDGEVIDIPRYPVKANMIVVVNMPEYESDETLLAEDFEFPIVYEDKYMLVINKPYGVVVHPAAGNASGTIVNALMGRYPEFATDFSFANERPGIVHRLDKDTSGCLVVAKTPDAQYKLGSSFAERETSKTYLAIVRGIPAKKSDEINTLIGRHPGNRQKMAVVPCHGKVAVSRYKVLKSGVIDRAVVSVVEVQILTGRTHQIRVHMNYIGHPILGDGVYGGVRVPIEGVTRQMLHAWKLSVPHPFTGELMNFESPIPEDMQEVLDRIKNEE